jgi:nitroimidazol reductase NimA-like FMN-containing flavoprotein (pyridoxamine 5'-phosphate oxidase superfamily)
MDTSLRKLKVPDPRKLSEDLHDLFLTQPLAVLCTSGEGQPCCSLVAFATSDDIRELVFVTNRSTRKYTNLSSDPRVSLLIDNRTNEVSDFHAAMAVSATGTASEVSDRERGRLLMLYLGKHPHLEEFALSPGCALVVVRVSRYTVVRQFQSVMELEIE